MVWDRLDDSERTRLAALRREPGFYGVLRSTTTGTLEAVGREVALLLLTLTEPGPVPFFAREPGPRATAELLRRLVLDGVLEIEHQGRFVSGPAALDTSALDPATSDPAALDPAALDPAVRGSRTPASDRPRDGAPDLTVRAPVPGTRIERLTLEALRWAASWPPGSSSARLALRLYSYNSLPRAPEHDELDAPGAVESFLGLAEGGGARKRLRRDWRPIASSHPEGERARTGWLSFRSRRSESAVAGPSGDLAHGRYKLYCSPLPEALAEMLPVVLSILAARGARGWKVGRDAAGLLRPDKLVAYFDRRIDLERAATELSAELSPDHFPGSAAGGSAEASSDAPNRVQGVPLTAPIDDAGLFSWGIDPPDPSRRLPWQQRQSWRWWLVQRFVAALDVAALDVEKGAEPVRDRIESRLRFGLESLAVRGVDVHRWLPRPSSPGSASSPRR